MVARAAGWAASGECCEVRRAHLMLHRLELDEHLARATRLRLARGGADPKLFKPATRMAVLGAQLLDGSALLDVAQSH